MDVTRQEVKLVSSLQGVHDDVAVSDWESWFAKVAKEFDLDYGETGNVQSNRDTLATAGV